MPDAPDGLFALIKSLTRQEKRYFKLHASMQGDEKNYLRLFDAIDAQEEYDGDALRELFKKERFARQLHVTKNYLYRMIMRSLRAFHAESSIDARIADLLFEARILYEKGLRRNAGRALERARKLALEHERDTALLDVLDFEAASTLTHGNSEEAIEALRRRRGEIMRRIENIYDFDALSDRMSLVLLANGKPREGRSSATLDEIVTHPLLSSRDNALSCRAHHRYCYIHGSYHYANGNTAEAQFYLREQLASIEGRPERLPDLATAYVGTLTNLLVLHPNDDREGFATLLAKLRAVSKLASDAGASSERLDYRIFNFSYGIELSTHLRCGEFVQAAELFERVEKGLETYRRLVTPVDRLRFDFLFAYTFLGLGELSQAVEHINRVVSLPEPPARLQVYYWARLLELMIHFEIGNLELLEYKVRSVYRFLKGRENLFRFEETMLRYFRKIPDLGSMEEVIASFARLHAEIASLSEIPHERNAFSYVDFLAWLESKVERRSLAETIARRFNTESGEPESHATRSL